MRVLQPQETGVHRQAGLVLKTRWQTADREPLAHHIDVRDAHLLRAQQVEYCACDPARRLWPESQ